MRTACACIRVSKAMPGMVQTRVMPDEEVLAEAQAGNLAPQAAQNPLAAVMQSAFGGGAPA